MKKLLLLITDKCNRTCHRCCNKDLVLKDLPYCTSFAGYDEVTLTGGEPFLDARNIWRHLALIRKQNAKADIFMYTATIGTSFATLLSFIQGVTLTVHNQQDVEELIKLDEKLYYSGVSEGKSLRLKAFKGVEVGSLRCDWQLKKSLVWLEDCPPPEDKVFMQTVWPQEG